MRKRRQPGWVDEVGRENADPSGGVIIWLAFSFVCSVALILKGCIG